MTLFGVNIRWPGFNRFSMGVAVGVVFGAMFTLVLSSEFTTSARAGGYFVVNIVVAVLAQCGVDFFGGWRQFLVVFLFSSIAFLLYAGLVMAIVPNL